jgi:hypothetical protein
MVFFQHRGHRLDPVYVPSCPASTTSCLRGWDVAPGCGWGAERRGGDQD